MKATPTGEPPTLWIVDGSTSLKKKERVGFLWDSHLISMSSSTGESMTIVGLISSICSNTVLYKGTAKTMPIMATSRMVVEEIRILPEGNTAMELCL